MLNFLNSTNRSYNGADLNKINEAILGNGVLDTTGSDFEVTKTTGLDVLVKKGSAIITVDQLSQDTNIIGTQNADTTLTCAANATNYIIYRAFQSVITGDTIDTNGTNSDAVEVVTSFPTDPYVLLATVTVPDLATSLTDEMIVDNRVFANIKQYMIDEIIETVYANDPLADIDLYSDGVSISNTSGSDVVSSVSDSGAQGVYISQSGGGYTFELRLWQRFTAPVDELGSLFLKKGITREDWNRPIKISVRNVLAGGEIGSTEIDTFTFTTQEWQSLTPNTPFELKLTGSYSQGTEYGILFEADSSADSDDSAVLITSSQTDISIPTLRRNFNDIIGTSPFDEYYDVAGLNLWFRINTREIVDLGTPANARIGQVFTSSSTDLVSITLKKGRDQGTPTGNINFRLYEIDSFSNPTDEENPIAEKVMQDSEWDSISNDAEFDINMSASLSQGTKYMISIETENTSETNYRQLWASTLNDVYSDGGMRKYSGSIWSNLDYDLYFKTRIGSGNKIVQTTPDGFINPDLIEQSLPSLFFSPIQVSGGETIPGRVFMMNSPSGKRFSIITQDSSNIYSVNNYLVTRGQVKKTSLHTLTTGDAWDWFYIDDERVGYVVSDNGFDQQRLFVRDTNISETVNGNSSSRQWSRSYTGIHARGHYNKFTNEIWIQNAASSTWHVLSADDYSVKNGGANNLNTLNIRNIGYDYDGNMVDATSTRQSHSGDGIWLANGTFSRSVDPGYWAAYAINPSKKDEYYTAFSFRHESSTEYQFRVRSKYQ